MFKFLRNIVLPLLAVAGFVFALMAAQEATQPVASQPQVVAPAVNPYKDSVSGAGIVEPASENIAVAPPIGGVVTDIFVTRGQHVKAGEALFLVDDRPTKAQLAVQLADVAGKKAAELQAEANLAKLKEGYRKEDVPIYRAKYEAALALQQDAEDQWNRMQALIGSGARSDDDINRRKFAAIEAKANTASAKADLDKLLAGSWDKDIAIAEAQLASAKQDVVASQARADAIQVDLDRLSVKNPVDGTVLRINIRKGEYAAAAGVGNAQDAAIVIGDVDHLNVRVDIDENDVPRFKNGAGAIGYVRGQTKNGLPMTFVRVDPFVIPKKNLTGSNTERVDTRVLQVIYRVEKGDAALYVGQQMDVFVDAGGEAVATR